MKEELHDFIKRTAELEGREGSSIKDFDTLRLDVVSYRNIIESCFWSEGANLRGLTSELEASILELEDQIAKFDSQITERRIIPQIQRALTGGSSQSQSSTLEGFQSELKEYKKEHARVSSLEGKLQDLTAHLETSESAFHAIVMHAGALSRFWESVSCNCPFEYHTWGSCWLFQDQDRLPAYNRTTEQGGEHRNSHTIWARDRLGRLSCWFHV